MAFFVPPISILLILYDMIHSIDKETDLYRNMPTPSKRIGHYKRIQQSRRIRHFKRVRLSYFHRYAKYPITERRPLAILLPPELISTILWMVLENSQSNFYHDYENGYLEQIKSVVNATRTCRQWRAAALGDRALWGALINIENNQKVWLEELIRRSEPSGSLVVQSHDFFEDTRVSWEGLLLPNNIKKIKILQVEGPESHLYTVLDRFCHPAPALECFEIREAHADDEPMEDVFRTKIRLFADCAPALKCLSIDVGFFLPKIDFFSGFKLRHLSIYNADSCLGMDIIDWLDALAEQPYLECLHLSVFDRFDYRDSQSCPKFREVHLDNLKVLRLKGCGISEAGDLLGSLVFPASCNVMIALDQSKDLQYSLNGLERGLTRYLRAWKSRVNYCAIQAGLDDQFEIIFEGKQNLSDDCSDLGSLTIKYSVGSENWSDGAYISPLSSFLDLIRVGARQLASITGAEMIFNFSLGPSQKNSSHPENANLKQSLLALFSAFSSQTSFLLVDKSCSASIIQELIKVQIPEPCPSTSKPTLTQPLELFPNLSDLAIYHLIIFDPSHPASSEKYFNIMTAFDEFQGCKRWALNGFKFPTERDSVGSTQGMHNRFALDKNEIGQSDVSINYQQHSNTPLRSMSVKIENISCPWWREVPDEYVSHKLRLVFESDSSKQKKEVCRCLETLQ